ncbi:MAG: GNAT family N-acetyltransferase, partial [Waterburya sp.]
YEETEQGFYCNWNVIESSYKKKQLCCVTKNNEAVGLAAWWSCDLSASLDIVVVSPDLRGSGLGKTLVDGCFNHFRNIGILTVELQCQPPTSEPIWRHLGFRGFPTGVSRSNHAVHLYRPIVESLEPTNQANTSEVLELWDKDPWVAKNSEPTWRWEICRQQGEQKLLKPIIFPCDKNWRLSWREGDTIVFDDKVKYALNGALSHGDYLIVRELLAL